MKYAPSDEPNQETDGEEEQQPSIVASVGSGALKSAEIEPQREHNPDNDGETVEDVTD